MLYAAFLIIHIATAITAAIVALAALFDGIGPGRALRALGYSASIQIATGSALAVASPQVSVLSLCDDLAFYISLYVVVGFILYRRIAPRSARATFVVPAAATIASLAMFAGTALAGL